MSDKDRPLSEKPDDVEAILTDAKAVVQPEPENDAEIEPEPETENRPDMAAAPKGDAEKPAPRHDVIEPPKSTPKPVPQPAAPKSGGGGFVGMVLGGALAFAGGYGVASYYPFVVKPSVDQAQQQALEKAVAELDKKLAALESAKPADNADRLAAIEQRLTDLPNAAPDLAPVEQAVASLEQRLALVETMPAGTGDGAPSAAMMSALQSLETEVQQLKGAGAATTAEIEKVAADAKARLAEAEAQAAALKAEAEVTAKKALARASVGRLQAAMESGAPYGAALADLGEMEIPEILTANADAGIPSINALAKAFPESSRAALEASLHADMGATWAERLGTFLKSTTGARSLSPREGSDPDAILSRAEAAVQAGDLATALAEIATLPEAGQAAMADWAAKANLRIEATGAVAALSAKVEG